MNTETKLTYPFNKIEVVISETDRLFTLKLHSSNSVVFKFTVSSVILLFCLLWSLYYKFWMMFLISLVAFFIWGGVSLLIYIEQFKYSIRIRVRGDCFEIDRPLKKKIVVSTQDIELYLVPEAGTSSLGNVGTVIFTAYKFQVGPNKNRKEILRILIEKGEINEMERLVELRNLLAEMKRFAASSTE